MAKIATNSPLSGLNSDCLGHIDISTLSQSELHALSLCSDAAFDLRRSDDLVIPHIDRSVFNESAGSRRQTYSHLRLRSSSATPGHPRPRLPGLLPSLKPHPPSIDPENKSIVNYLKQLLHEDHNSSSHSRQMVVFGDAVAVPEIMHNDGDRLAGSGAQELEIVVHSSERKRKRDRKHKVNKLQESGVGIELDIVNRNGVVVDFVALANADDLYIEELRRRTVGLGTEEEVLEFLRGLEGQWCSRRRKRKIVDASEFGDSLPIGWKLLLGLKRRERHVSVYCRRYIRWYSLTCFHLY